MSANPSGQESDRIRFLRAALIQCQQEAAEARARLTQLDADYQENSFRLYSAWLDADAAYNLTLRQLAEQSP
jgi:hypothetical protein